MEKQSTITAFLGVTQRDMAMLLNVTRTQWSMYELGKRNLPLAVLQLLAEMLEYVNAPDSSKNLLPQTLREQLTQNQLERLLHENQFQQALVAKKIDAITRKRDTQLRQFRLQEFLNARQPDGTATPAGFSFALPKGMHRVVEEKILEQLVTLQLKLDVLAVEKGLIEAELGQ